MAFYHRVFILLFFALTLTHLSIAQKKGQALVDSLEQELPGKKEDTAKVKILNSLAGTLALINTKESIRYGQSGLELATKLGWKPGMALANRYLGYDYLNNEPERALEYYIAALKAFEELKDNISIVKVRTNMGVIYKALNDYPNAIDNYEKALKMYEEQGNKQGVSICIANIGGVYLAQNNYPKAREYYNRSLRMAEEQNDKTTAGAINASIGKIYFAENNYPDAMSSYLKALKIDEETGNTRAMADVDICIATVFSFQNDSAKALEYNLKALKIAEETGEKPLELRANKNIGYIYYTKHEYPQALEYFQKALKIQKEAGSKLDVALTAGQIGNIYAELKNYSKAIEYEEQSLKLERELNDSAGIKSQLTYLGYALLNLVQTPLSGPAAQVTQTEDSFIPEGNVARLEKAIDLLQKSLAMERALQDPIGMQSTYEILSIAYKLKGDYQQALDYYQNSTTLKDSLDSKENEKKIVRQEMKYNFDKREDSLKVEEEKKQIFLQKEMELKAVRYEYEKKQAAAKSEKERQQLKYEQELKERKIEDDYTQKMAAIAAEQKQKEAERRQQEALAKVKQDEKDIRQRNIRNFILVGLAATLVFSVVVYRQRNRVTKEKKRSDELLLNILPAEVAEELKEKGSAEAKLIDEVTVLFTDFKGFTQLSEKLSPKALVAEINECFSAFDQIIQKHGIEKIKTIGDSYMAAGGLPVPNSSHADDVVKAALEIQQYMHAHKLKKEAAGQLFFEVRLGIHTGPVVAGIVGIKKFQYDIWGDTVNTASRMESSGEVGKVNISGTTYEKVKNDFKCVYRGKVSAKGKGEVDMYFVERNVKNSA